MFISLNPTVVLAKKWGIGVGYPYLFVKYHANPETAYELRVGTKSGINTYSGRLYKDLGSFLDFTLAARREATIFGGLEGGIIDFKNGHIKGNGYFAMLFVGFEETVSKSIALSLCIGPAYVSLSSEGTTVDEIAWVYDLYLIFYFR